LRPAPFSLRPAVAPKDEAGFSGAETPCQCEIEKK